MPVPTTFGIVSRTKLATTWNAADKASKVTLSGGNLTAARTDLTGDTYASVRATTSRAAGKWYFEITINLAAAGNNAMALGVANGSAALNEILGFNANSIGALNAALVTQSGIYFSSALVFNGSNYATGNVVCIAVDLNAERMWYRVDGGTWYGSAAGDPATGSNGADFSSLTGPYFPAATLRNATSTQITANFGASAFAQTPPSGFTAWNG